MALTNIAFGALSGGVTANGGAVLALNVDTVTQEDIVPGGSALETTVEAGNYGSQPMCRVATDTAIYVSFGTAPDAATDLKRVFVPAGVVEYLAVKTGYICSVLAA